MPTELITMQPKPGASPAPCRQEPGGCVETCCSLDTLVRPRFFCGQLLTDHDLMDLVLWTQEKHRLGRFRPGWGAVCGLDVRCGGSGEGVVTSGYAVSCCGGDIVVPVDCPFDLSRFCGRDPDPRDPPYSRLERERAQKAAAGRAPFFRGGYLEDVSPEGDPGDLLVFDLAIRYCERGADPQEALARDICGQGGACVDSRTREEYRFVATRACGDEDDVSDAADRWKRGFDGCLDVLGEYARSFRPSNAGRRRKAEA